MDEKVFGAGPPDHNGGATQSVMGEHTARGYAASSAPRPFFAQSKIGAVFLMVGDALGKKPLPGGSPRRKSERNRAPQAGHNGVPALDHGQSVAGSRDHFASWISEGIID